MESCSTLTSLVHEIHISSCSRQKKGGIMLAAEHGKFHGGNFSYVELTLRQ